jgi:hypothetical protein
MEGRVGTLYSSIRSDDSIDPGGFGNISRDVLTLVKESRYTRNSEIAVTDIVVTNVMKRFDDQTGSFALHEKKSFNASQRMELGLLLILFWRTIMEMTYMSSFPCQNS